MNETVHTSNNCENKWVAYKVHRLVSGKKVKPPYRISFFQYLLKKINNINPDPLKKITNKTQKA